MYNTCIHVYLYPFVRSQQVLLVPQGAALAAAPGLGKRQAAVKESATTNPTANT